MVQLLANFFVIYEVSTLGRSQSKIDRLDEALVIFQVVAQDLLREFVRFQAFLGSDLRQSRLFFRMQMNVHAFSLGSAARGVKWPRWFSLVSATNVRR